MNILMILANPFTHDPRVYNEAMSLIKSGHKITVLGWDRKNKNPLFEEKDGMKIVRTYNTKFMKLLLHDLFRFRFWYKQGYKDALKLHKKTPFDIIHCHDFDTLRIGIRLKKELDLPLIYDAHELWGYRAAAYLPRIIGEYFQKQEKNLLKFVDHIITVNQPLKDYYSKITNKPITIIMNCKNLIGTKYEPPNNEKFTILYLGAIDNTRFLLELVDVVKEIPDVQCIIGGKCSRLAYYNALTDRCSKANNVKFLGQVPMEKVIPMTKKADVIFCMVDPNNINTKNATAIKQLEAMVCGRPIICTRYAYSGDITEKEKCGLVVDYKKESLSEAILKLKNSPKLCEDFGRNALKAAIREYNWQKQEEKLKEVYNKIRRS